MASYDLYDINFDWDGASDGVLPDVSMSEPATQPTTATGTGTGYYVPSDWTTGLFGTVSQALNYALLRDQQQIAAKTGTVVGGVPVTATPAAAAAAANSRILLLGGIAVALAFVLRSK